MAAKSNSLRYVALAAALLLSLAGAAYIRYELVFLVPYILAVLIVYRWGHPKDIYVVAAFSTLLIVAGLWRTALRSLRPCMWASTWFRLPPFGLSPSC